MLVYPFTVRTVNKLTLAENEYFEAFNSPLSRLFPTSEYYQVAEYVHPRTECLLYSGDYEYTHEGRSFLSGVVTDTSPRERRNFDISEPEG